MADEIKSEEVGSSSTQQVVVKKKTSTGQKVIIILIVLVLIGGGVFAYFMLNKKDTSPNTGGNYVIDKDNLGDVTDQMSDKVNEGMFECSMTTSWNFKNAKSASSDAYVANANSNHKPIYFDLTLDDTGEEIYKSTLIPVGNKLKELKLDKQDLAAGTYNVTCTYHLMDEQDDGTYTEYSKVAFAVVINIQE